MNNMKKNIELIIQIIFFFTIAIPTAICFYIANEIYFLIKKKL
jgi:hypothetical protein